MIEPLYQTEVKCICCEMEFTTSRVRSSFKRIIASDSDFCGYYSDLVNPDFYVVRVCPFCGYASTENGKEALTDVQRSEYYNKIGKHWVNRNYSGERTLAQAMESYKLALVTAQTIDEKPRVIAGILHHIAWLYRYEKRKADEQRFLRFALDAYLLTYETEESSLNNARLMYLIGELHRRLEEYREAVHWFSRIINDKRIMDAMMIQKAREQWQLLRAEMLGLEEYEGLDIVPNQT